MEKILRNLIAAGQHHCITYEQYMNTVLYHPEKGYYQKPADKIGKSGDFYTSPSVHPVFGRALARFFIDFFDKEGLSPIICEVGAGDGRLAAAILEEWERLSPESYKGLTYIVVEESAFHRQAQQGNLSLGRPVFQYNCLEDVREKYPAFSGIIFSNELFDAFPVRVVENVDGSLHEIKVGFDEGGSLAEVKVPCEDRRVYAWIKTYGFPLEVGQRIEIPLVMTSWLKSVAEWVSRGALLTIDYGYTEREWKQPSRKAGSLRGYYRHHLVDNPLLRPGKMDLTTHIHVDAVRKIAEECGMDHLFTRSQKDFLLRAGILDYLEESGTPDPFSPVHRQNRAVNALISDNSLGSSFYAILQGKRLSGRFAKDWNAAERTPILEEIQKRR